MPNVAKESATSASAIDPKQFGNIWLVAVRVVGGSAAAWLLAETFPRHGVPWLAPVALAGVFLSWRGLSYRASAALAFFEGIVFYAFVYAWFVETVAQSVGPFAPLLLVGAALFSAWSWALAAVLAVLFARRLRAAAVPPALALAFTLCEYLRLQGPLADPFGSLAEPFAATPFAALATVGGSSTITLGIAVVAAYLAEIVARPRASRAAAGAVAAVALACAVAWAAWPARRAAPREVSVALVQGDIPQNVKWSRETLATSVDRYIALTESIHAHPRIVLWPETVITVYLSLEPDLRSRFAELAQRMGTTLVVGSDDLAEGRAYNALWFFDSAGEESTYHKEHLVPFAEYLPARSVLGALPIARLVSTFSPGSGTGVFDANGITLGALVCYESGFSDLVFRRVSGGAQVLLVATDDGWFGSGDGPYEHAEIARLRAVETGRWVVRAAATGISVVIAPDGRFVDALDVDERGTIVANVGLPQPTLFSKIGPRVVALILAVALALVAAANRQNVRVATIVSV